MTVSKSKRMKAIDRHLKEGRDLLQREKMAYDFWVLTDCDLYDVRALHSEREEFERRSKQAALPSLRVIEALDVVWD